MKDFFLLIFILLFVLTACQPVADEEAQKPTTVNLLERLPGTWEAISFRVNIPTVDNSDRDSLFEVSEEYWVEKFRVKPVKTIFNPDKTYRQEFRNLQDTLVSTNKGIWNVFGDTLMMIEPNTTYNYTVNIEKGIATFRSTTDWDNDGDEDDEFTGKHRLISRSYD